MPLLVVNFQASLWAQHPLTQQQPDGIGQYPERAFLSLQCPTLESPLLFSIHSFSSLLPLLSLPAES